MVVSLLLAKECSFRETESSSNMQATKALWQGIWNISGARVVKMFLWQACNNILPTKEKVYNKYCITPDPLCLVRGRETQTETSALALWSCTSARDVWLDPVQSESPEMHK
jgi:hypothetical protein